MKQRVLAIGDSGKGLPEYYEVTSEYLFENAKELIRKKEQAGQRFDGLFISVENLNAFWEFLEWMDTTGKVYPVGILCYRNRFQYILLRTQIRHREKKTFIDVFIK